MWVPLYVRRPSDFANLGTLIAQETGASGALLPASRRAPASTAGLQPAITCLVGGALCLLSAVLLC